MKTNKYKPYFLLTTAIIFASLTSGIAQTGEYNERVTVIGTYQPQLSEARKINFTPEPRDTIISVPKMTYTLLPALIQIPIEVTPIQPAKVTGETFAKLYKNYLKVGFGNYQTSYIEYFYQTIRNKKLRGGVHLKHLASGGNIKDYAFPGQSDNMIKAYGSLISGDYIFSSDISYNREVIHYYGFQSKESLRKYTKNDIKQIYKMLDFNVLAESKLNGKNRWHNRLGLSYLGLWDDYNAKENTVLLQGNVRKDFNLARFIKDESFHIDINGGFYGQETSIQQMSNGLVSVKPYLKMRFDDLELTGGLNASAIIDSVGKLLIHPIARIDIYLVPEYLRIFFGLDGSVSRNTFREYIHANPFVNTEHVAFDFTETQRELKGGVIGGFGGIFNYKLQAMNRQMKNMALFINDTLPFLLGTDTLIVGNRFEAVHDNVDIFSVSAEFSLDVNPKFQILLQSAYHVYSPVKQSKAWHLPLYDGSIGFIYNIQDKIYAKAQVFAYGERYASLNGAEKRLAPIWDFSLGGEYRYSKLLSGFVQLNNITAQRHNYWYNYPGQRFNLMLGVTYSF